MTMRPVVAGHLGGRSSRAARMQGANVVDYGLAGTDMLY